MREGKRTPLPTPTVRCRGEGFSQKKRLWEQGKGGLLTLFRRRLLRRTPSLGDGGGGLERRHTKISLGQDQRLNPNRHGGNGGGTTSRESRNRGKAVQKKASCKGDWERLSNSAAHRKEGSKWQKKHKLPARKKKNPHGQNDHLPERPSASS